MRKFWLLVALAALGLPAAGCGRTVAPAVKTAPAAAAAPEAFDYMPLPIYPDAQKTADSRTRSQDRRGRTVEHQIIVILSPSRPTLVKAWYQSHMKASVVMDEPATDGQSRIVTLTEPAGERRKALPPNTVVLQSGGQAGTQITLSAYRYVR